MEDAQRDVPPLLGSCQSLSADTQDKPLWRRVLEHLTPLNGTAKPPGKLAVIRLIVGYPIDRSTFQYWRNGRRRVPLWAARRILARLESDWAILAEMIPAVEDHIRRLEKEGDRGLKGPKDEREL